jgi:hypothetical protein
MGLQRRMGKDMNVGASKIAAFVGTAALLGAGTASAASAPTVVLHTPGHSPAVGKHWSYTLTITAHGKPAAAKLTEQIVDPIGGVHTVQLGLTKKNITSLPVKGTFTDFIIWPADSRGIPLTLRVTVVSGGAKKVIDYHVTPR